MAFQLVAVSFAGIFKFFKRAAINKPQEQLEEKPAAVEERSFEEEIFDYLLVRELKRRPTANYMVLQPMIDSHLRANAVGWIVDQAEESSFVPQTIHLAVSFLDRYLSVTEVTKEEIQVVAPACLLLAVKLEEVNASCKTSVFSIMQEDIYKVEKDVFETLHYDLSLPTCLEFLHGFLQPSCVPDLVRPRMELLAKYLCELTILDDTYLKYRPSTIAASAVVLSLHTLHQPTWNPALTRYGGFFGLRDLQFCIRDLHDTFCRAPDHPEQGIRRKYLRAEQESVSELKPQASFPWIHPILAPALNGNERNSALA